MEKLGQPRKRGINKNQLLFWGMLFLLAGMISRSFLQNRVLQMGGLTAQQLLETISASSAAMAAATAALVMQALETCAIPIFAFLLVNAYEKTASRRKLLVLLAIVAAVSEVPFDLVVSGKYWDIAAQNPVIAMVIGVIVLYFWRRYGENTAQNVLVKVVVGMAAVLWSVMLRVEHGVELLILVIVMWIFRNKAQMRILFSAVASTACALVSPFYMVSAMGVLPVYMYRKDEEQAGTEIGLYFVYPVLLLVLSALSSLI